jgi:hypothetical protein
VAYNQNLESNELAKNCSQLEKMRVTKKRVIILNWHKGEQNFEQAK